MAVLFSEHLRYDWHNPVNRDNDHLIFSKVHASPLLYAMFHAAGVLEPDKLDCYWRLGSRLEGDPTPRPPWVDVATGSFGFALPVGVGITMAMKYLDLCSAVLQALAADGRLAGLSVESLAVRTMPGSATPGEQLAAAEIDIDAIIAAARRPVSLASV